MVNKLGRPDLINDIINVTVSPLSLEEGRLFIQRLALELQGSGDKLIQDRYAYQDYFENWKTRLKQALNQG